LILLDEEEERLRIDFCVELGRAQAFYRRVREGFAKNAKNYDTRKRWEETTQERALASFIVHCCFDVKFGIAKPTSGILILMRTHKRGFT